MKYFTERDKKARGPAVVHGTHFAEHCNTQYIYIYESYVCVFPMYISLSVMYISKLSAAYLHKYTLGSFSAYKSEAMMKLANVRYRAIQEERSIYWEMLLSVIVRKKKVHMEVCLILTDYRERELFESTDLNTVRFLSVGLHEERSLQKKDGCTRRIARSHFGCCCQHTEA